MRSFAPWRDCRRMLAARLRQTPRGRGPPPRFWLAPPTYRRRKRTYFAPFVCWPK